MSCEKRSFWEWVKSPHILHDLKIYNCFKICKMNNPKKKISLKKKSKTELIKRLTQN